jgi:hypothetical protein
LSTHERYYSKVNGAPFSLVNLVVNKRRSRTDATGGILARSREATTHIRAVIDGVSECHQSKETILGNCKYCGKPAGFLSFKHKECEEQHVQLEHSIQAGKQQISLAASDWIGGSDDFDGLEKTISAIEKSSFVPITERRALLIEGWERAVKQFVDNGIVSPAEEERLDLFKTRFSLTEGDLDLHGAYSTLVKSCVLRDILNGIVPQRCSIDGNLPVNLQKGEQVVWAFPQSKYLEDRVRREYVGGSQGVSVRVMKGVYYHVGAFKGQAVEHTESIHIDTGLVVVTNKSIYFSGPVRSLRLPYAKIVSFESFSNGIGIFRDAANAKAQFLLTGDGWFTYNLVMNLSKL